MRSSPCKDCPRRTILCHAHCKDYPKWVAQLAEERRAERTAADADAHTARTIEYNLRKGRYTKRRGQR